MKELIPLVCLLSVGALGAPNSRIVGGEDANLGDVPFIVSVRSFGLHKCGGSIISDEYILTAAHCSVGFLKEKSIQYGRLNISNSHDYDESIINVAEVILHENYNIFTLQNDIALLRLEDKIKFSKNVAAAKLPNQNEFVPVGVDVLLAGWGRLSFGGTRPIHLQKVTIQVVDNKKCQAVYHFLPIYESNVCAGVPEGGKGQCNGDGGGPLSLNGKVIGLASWSVKPCTVKGYPGVLTRVASYRNWIREKSGV